MNQVSTSIKDLSPRQRKLLLMRLGKLNKVENGKSEFPPGIASAAQRWKHVPTLFRAAAPVVP